MDKNILKVLIDTVKYGDNYKTRPGLAGAVITEHQREGEKSYLYCSNGYSLIRLECGGALCLPFNESMFWPLDKMLEEYKKIKKGEKAMIAGAIHKNENARLGEDFTYNNQDFSTPDYKALIDDIEKRAEGENMANNMALDLELLKTITPLGRLSIKILNTGYGAKVLKAEGEGVLFIQMGLKEH